MATHDQRFKTLIQRFFAEFLLLFFADWVPRFDLKSIEWLKPELLPNPPDGSRHILDLVAKLKLTQPVPGFGQDSSKECFAAIHFEIESPDQMALIDRRMPTYHIHLRNETGLPVLPIVIFLRVVGEGVGTREYSEKFFELETLVMRYLYVALAGLDGVEYVQSDNWLGVALSALMRIPPDRVAWLGAEALRRISEAPLSQQDRFLLGECVQAYLPMDDSQRKAFDDLLTNEAYIGVKAMNKTVYEKGLEDGAERNRKQFGKEGMLKVVINVLESKFGFVPQETQTRLESFSDDQLLLLSRRIYNLNSLEELTEISGSTP